MVVVVVQPGEDAPAIARRVLGDASKTSRVRALDGALRPGSAAAVALHPLDPGGLSDGRPQMAVVLCYHRFATDHGDRLDVTAAQFEQQLSYLRDHGYSVIPLQALSGFLAGDGELPPKPVVITIDDGYRSAYTVAFPLLKRFGYPATLFVYTDFLGAPAALKPGDIKEMQATGLVQVDSHTKTHSDLRIHPGRETPADYRRRLDFELSQPIGQLSQLTGRTPRAIAYPYGAADDQVKAEAARKGFSLGLSVIRGGNPSWADPMLLRREMVFGTDTLALFARRLGGSDAEAP